MVPSALERAAHDHGILNAQRATGRAQDWKGTIIWLARTEGREIREGEPPAELAIGLIGERRWSELLDGGDVPDDVVEPYAREGT